MLRFPPGSLAVATIVSGGAGAVIGSLIGVSMTGVIVGAAIGGGVMAVRAYPVHRPARDLARQLPPAKGRRAGELPM